MTNNYIACPHCGKEIELQAAMSQLVQNEIAQKSIQLEKDTQERNKSTLETFKVDFQKQMEVQKQNEIDAALEQHKKQNEEHQQKIQELLSAQQESDRKRIEAEELILQKQNEIQAKESELSKQKEELQKENERLLFEERQRLEGLIRQEVDTQNRLKMAENGELIAQLSKKITDLERTASQTSQQLSGEAQEIALEEVLKVAFPSDIIEPVPKGYKGADCLQRIRVGTETIATIIWESKRTKQWLNEWINKLKDDQRAARAEIAIIVTQTMPSDMSRNRMGNVDGIWLTDFASAIGLAMALRAGLIEVARMKTLASGGDDKTKTLFEYVCSPEFRQFIQAVIDTFISFKDDLESEKRSMAKQWAKREKTIERVLLATNRMHGSLQSILGSGAMPDVNATPQLTA